MTSVSSSGSPCLSPIRYSLDTSQLNQSQSYEKSADINENIISMQSEDIQSNQILLPTDDSSLKVSIIRKTITSLY
jgi:hypothetical protein